MKKKHCILPRYRCDVLWSGTPMVTFPAETRASKPWASWWPELWIFGAGDEKKVTLYLLDKLTLSGLFKLIDLIFCNHHAYNLVGLIKAFGTIPRCCVYGDLNLTGGRGLIKPSSSSVFGICPRYRWNLGF